MINIDVTNIYTDHNNLVVISENIYEVCDTYYFAIDDAEKNSTTGQNIMKLLSDWLTILHTISDNKSYYLPIDFSDEYIGCIRICTENSIYKMDYGYTREYEGWSVLPTRCIPFMIDDENYTSTNKSITISIDDFKIGIKESIQRISTLNWD